MRIWKLAVAQIRIYLRDRQSVFFALFFPLFFMLALGYGVDRDPDTLALGVVPASSAAAAGPLLEALRDNTLIDTTVLHADQAHRALEEGELDVLVFLPDAPFDSAFATPVALEVRVNAAQPRQAQHAVTLLKAILGEIERDVRQTPALFTLAVENINTRTARYIDFLIPGLLAFMVLQLSIAGSGFNIVEYKRKGILKRLFVTPLRPAEFIAALIVARLAIILVQISLLLGLAHLVFDVSIHGSLLLLYLFVIAGGILFLSIGFTLGGIANTQSAILALGNIVIFPQLALAGVFFPLDALPAWLRPVATLLPLNFLSDALRRVGNDGAALGELGVDLLGLGVWLVIGVFLAVRFFRWSDVAASSGHR